MPDDPKSVMLRLYAAVSAGDGEAIDELLADDVVEHEQFPGLQPGKEGVKQFFALLKAAFPDIEMQAQEMVAEGDLVSARFTCTGTHNGAFMGVAATGRHTEIEGIDMVRVLDGKAVEHWGVADTMSLMQQIGAIPDETPA